MGHEELRDLVSAELGIAKQLHTRLRPKTNKASYGHDKYDHRQVTSL